MLDNVARFVGQRVAAVVADTEAAAEEGCRLVEVDYEVLPAVFDAEEAMLPGAPHLHGGGAGLPDPDPGAQRLQENRGREPATWPAGFAEADADLRRHVLAAKIQHAHMETHGSIAVAQPTTAASTSAPARRPRTSPRSSSPTCSTCIPQQIHVFSEYVGGGFGGSRNCSPRTCACWRR